MNVLRSLANRIRRVEQDVKTLGAAPPAHTHAASAITSGTLVHERGGLEADVSAYSGLVKITGGSTSAVTVTAAGEALLDDAAASDQRTTLGLGTLATQSGTFSGTSSGTNTGDQTIQLTGDVTGSGTGSFAATIANDAVTYAKIQNVSATDKVLGRSTAGSGDVEEIACTAAGRAILDDADASAQRTTLGLGTLATQSGTFSGTSSGTNTGDQSSVAGLPTGTSPPGSPSAGMQYYDTTDDTIYTYDATRSHWFGPPITLTLGNSGAVSPGYMRFGNNVGTGTLGWYVPYNCTITEAQFNNSNSITATLEMRVGGVSQGTLTITTAASASSTSLDIDIASAGIFCPYITATVGTPTNCSVVVICKRRKS